MIYCNLKNLDDNSATYDFGLRSNDMSGIVIFHKDNNEPEIIKLPKEEKLALVLCKN